jgi:two-component system, chemotaxis family, sensor kinase CheA
MSDEIVREFLVEGNENLDALDRELVQLEKDPRNHATLASVFRTIHTIKGTCGFLGFTKLESVAHVGENLLSRLRDGEILLNPQIATALLKMVDAVRQMMQSIEATGSEGERQDEDLIKLLATIHLGASAPDSDEQPKSGPVRPQCKSRRRAKPAGLHPPHPLQSRLRLHRNQHQARKPSPKKSSQKQSQLRPKQRKIQVWKRSKPVKRSNPRAMS